MGTRCLTVIKDSRDKEICVIYRQSDGYPSGHGVDLCKFLSKMEIVNGISGDESRKFANGMGCLAAQIISHFKCGVGGIYLYPSETRNVGEEYVYTITASIGGEEPTIHVDCGDGFVFNNKPYMFPQFLQSMVDDSEE